MDRTYTIVLLGRPRKFSTYSARGAAAGEIRDDGTLGPTAAGGSIAFTPEVVIPALIRMREKYGDDLFASYGFLDSFNPTFDFGIKPITQGRPRHRMSIPITWGSTRARYRP